MNKFNWKFNRRVVTNMYNRIFFMIMLEKKNLIFEIVKLSSFQIVHNYTDTFKKEKNLKLVYNTLEKEYTHRNIFKKDGKKISAETISEGTKIVYILIDDSQKCINPSLRRKRRKKNFFSDL